MGRVASSVDNTMMESFWSTMQRELLDRQNWATRDDLASAIFEWIEGFYNPVRRHTSIDGHAPVEFEHLHNHAATGGMITTPTVSGEPGQAPLDLDLSGSPVASGLARSTIEAIRNADLPVDLSDVEALRVGLGRAAWPQGLPQPSGLPVSL